MSWSPVNDLGSKVEDSWTFKTRRQISGASPALTPRLVKSLRRLGSDSALESTMSTSMPLGISRDASLLEKNIDWSQAVVQVPSCNGMRQLFRIRDISSASVASLMRVVASCECQIADLFRKV